MLSDRRHSYMNINNEVPPDETEDRGTNKHNLRLQSLDTRYPIPTVQPSVRPDSLPQGYNSVMLPPHPESNPEIHMYNLENLAGASTLRWSDLSLPGPY
jgi:hypothetical protein